MPWLDHQNENFIKKNIKNIAKQKLFVKWAPDVNKGKINHQPSHHKR